MPNIDTSTIEGFEGMTAEQKVEALLSVEVPEKVDLTGFVTKATFDKTASDLADAKKQLREKMTADEQAANAAAEATQKLQDDYNALLKKSTIAEHTANYLALGYDENLAKSTAEALFDGDMEKVFANQQMFNANREKELRAEIMKDTPRPNGAGGSEPTEKANEKLASQIGKDKAAAYTASDDILKHYM